MSPNGTACGPVVRPAARGKPARVLYVPPARCAWHTNQTAHPVAYKPNRQLDIVGSLERTAARFCCVLTARVVLFDVGFATALETDTQPAPTPASREPKPLLVLAPRAKVHAPLPSLCACSHGVGPCVSVDKCACVGGRARTRCDSCARAVYVVRAQAVRSVRASANPVPRQRKADRVSSVPLAAGCHCQIEPRGLHRSHTWLRRLIVQCARWMGSLLYVFSRSEFCKRAFVYPCKAFWGQNAKVPGPEIRIGTLKKTLHIVGVHFVCVKGVRSVLAA